MSTEDAVINRATRRVLFKEVKPVQSIPGAGSSAASGPRRHVKTKITINLDGDILEGLKDYADNEGVRYQTLINQILRDYLAGSKPERLAAEVADHLLSDKLFLAKLKALIES